MIRRRKEPWQKLVSGLYVPPLLRVVGGYHNMCCCLAPLLCDPPCIDGETPLFMYVRFHGITSHTPHFPAYTGPDTNDDWNETWWELKQLPIEGWGCRYRASRNVFCHADFGVTHTQPFPVVCGPYYDNYFLDLWIGSDGGSGGILTIGTCGTFTDSGFHVHFSEPLGELNEEDELDCMNIDVNWTQPHVAPFSLYCANWTDWSDAPDIDIKSPPDPR